MCTASSAMLPSAVRISSGPSLPTASTANAAAPASSDSTMATIDYSFYGNDPVLVRGDADLYSSRYNPSEFEIIVEHEIVNDRQVVCTVHSSVEETRWGSTKFRFPARSYVIYTAPSGQCVTGFRFHMTEQFTDYSTNWKTFEHYRSGRWSWAFCWTGQCRAARSAPGTLNESDAG